LTYYKADVSHDIKKCDEKITINPALKKIDFEDYHNSVTIVEENGRLLFRKTVIPHKRNFKNREWRLSQYFKNYAFVRHEAYNDHDIKTLNQEYTTNRLWKKAGILVPEFVRMDGQDIYFDFIPDALTLKQMIITEYRIKNVYNKFLILYDFIRKEAKKRGDVNFFHSDPCLKNFIYSIKHDNVLPIDSGMILNSKLSFEALDTHLLAATLKDIDSLDIPLKKKIFCLKQFRGILSKREINNILSLEFFPPKIATLYLNMRKGRFSFKNNKDNFKNCYSFLSGGLINKVLLDAL